MSYMLINILLAIIPALALTYYFYRRDSQKREPIHLIWKIFIIGFFSVLPAMVLEMLLDRFAGLGTPLQSIFARAFIVAALVEEGIKLSVVRLFVYRRSEFDEISDGIVYAITASMGFACFENILYSTGGIYAVLLRGISAVPLHATATGIMGYYIGYSKFTGSKAVIKGFALAILMHGLYNFLLFTGSLLSFLVIPLLVGGWLLLRKLSKNALRLDRMAGRS